MKLWRVPNPWDWHEIGAVFVVAETAEAAVRKARRRWSAKGRVDGASEYSRGSAAKPQWKAIEEVTGGVFFQAGCDD